MVDIPVDESSVRLRALLAPRSVAVIGASRERGSIGAEILHNIVDFGFTGKIFPVNPAAAEIQGLPSYSSILEIPEPVDLAVISVPGARVALVAEECGKKGVLSLVVISSGFREVGQEGEQRQLELVEICKRYNMRLVGPNCMGIANTATDIRLNATFSPQPPQQGRIALMTQSGAVGLAIIDYAAAQDLGFSGFVSVGNKADVSSNDLLEYWENDPNTDLILLYLESFGNPKKFANIARRVSRKKPIVAVKSGRSLAGGRAASSHTGALLGGSERAIDALLRQYGVIRTTTLEEMFGVASILAHQPIPQGKRVGILTNAGGPGIMCADACEAHGLSVPELGGKTRAELAKILPPQAGISNPIDMIASATPKQFEEGIRILAADEQVDCIIVMYIPPLVSDPEAVVESIVRATEASQKEAPQKSKPVLAVFLSHHEARQGLHTDKVFIPTFLFPETAVAALSHAIHYGEWRERPIESEVVFSDINRSQVADSLSRFGRDGWLPPDACCQLLDAYGLKRVRQRDARGAIEAGAVAEELGGFVALKGVAAGLVHKSEVGAVQVGLCGAASVSEAGDEMVRRITAAGYEFSHFVVQEMAPPGVEMIVGSVFDDKFGPVVVVGAGGVLSEIMNDTAVQLPPIGAESAARLIDQLRSSQLLKGFRGAAPSDRKALEILLMRFGQLVSDNPSIQEIDLNPVVVSASGALIVDCRIRVR